MSYNRKQEDRKKRHSAVPDKVKSVSDSSRNNERQKLKMGKWDV
jgi:hypothetical protein